METISGVRSAFHVNGKAVKQISREFRLSRNTVRSIVRGDETERRNEREEQPLPKLGAFTNHLDRMPEEIINCVIVNTGAVKLPATKLLQKSHTASGKFVGWCCYCLCPGQGITYEGGRRILRFARIEMMQDNVEPVVAPVDAQSIIAADRDGQNDVERRVAVHGQIQGDLKCEIASIEASAETTGEITAQEVTIEGWIEPMNTLFFIAAVATATWIAFVEIFLA